MFLVISNYRTTELTHYHSTVVIFGNLILNSEWPVHWGSSTDSMVLFIARTYAFDLLKLFTLNNI